MLTVTEFTDIKFAEPFQMAGFSIWSPGFKSFGIAVLLLLNFLQTVLLHTNGVFIHSDKVLIGPAFFYLNSQHDEPMCRPWESCSPSGHSHQKTYFTELVLLLCFYVPIVLVPFAMLGMLLAAYSKDRTTLQCSMACQAASSLLILGGIITFLISFHSYLSWKDMTHWFYLCVGVEAQLIITTTLTSVLQKELNSDWE